MRWLSASIYLGAALALVLMADADWERDLTFSAALIAAASLFYGWEADRWPAALLALALVLFALPLGYPDSDFAEPLPTWTAAAIWTPISAALILVGTAARRVWTRRR